MAAVIEIVKGDITGLTVNAIVNAANQTLLGGGGVDGAIHRAAGPGLLAECALLGGCRTGEAKITKGHRLPAKWVIHTVGPVWHGGKKGEPELLAKCYRNVFDLAEKKGIKSIAFPSISTGVFGYPVDQACRIALKETREFNKDHPEIGRVVFVCFDERTRQAYLKAYSEIAVV
jgi:O-acetyl-ADP-ribose deacetylase (regulator of RNase III)